MSAKQSFSTMASLSARDHEGVFCHQFSVPESAIDINGHVNNLEYLKWMQEIAVAHSAARGWNWDRYRQEGGSWVVRSHFIEYLRPSHVGDNLILLTWIGGFSHRSSPRHYLFMRADDHRPLVRARTEWVYVDAETGRPKPVPQAFREQFMVIADEHLALDTFRL
ncbi:acyl-CoA thioesterase [Ectothiorhodospira lacustris]|uniref:acyl-CoA thioesterase n=1 Tax=Ectothiorhodospira lacustris TaxID=2899127 RepID=UPI001EE91702|nr:acyl-CoA thioesterase [Ectothiorhodospira lacustris]MCG5499370.1 acyl-CoA thioesterase [Ectothiorhodospira lacustris]MCG5509259.1 acyl-CoA thioesterase [Ectothiorhodospira lacustris]MCG5521049.1 acyl-CoA thioesterase [Ectothiorhodospira lacustris]